MNDLSQEDIDRAKRQIEDWSEFLSIRNTPIYMKFMQRPEQMIAFFTGNQWGKNVNIVKHYITRWMGKHPVESKNLRPGTKIRMYRFCSETLPTDPEGGDRNTIYPVLKRLLPKWMIKKDVTQRKPIMTIKDLQGGPDFYVEFVSYGQELQSQAGVQRASVYIDENCPRSFFEEQLPRLLASDGDVVIGMTPALGQVTWQFEDIYEKAGTILRTPRVVKRLKKRFGEDHKEEEINAGGDPNICVLMAATDDNPHYDSLVKEKNEKDLELAKAGKNPVYKTEAEFVPVKKSEYIQKKLGIFDDETEDVRRYGIFRQVSGRIFKDFDNVHIISGDRYFPDGIPHNYLHARGIDYHESVPWHVGFIALSPNDEAFIYDEIVASPEKFVTLQIAKMIADKSKDYRYFMSKIDPLATKTQVNTGVSTVDDLNRIFLEFKRDSIGTGGYWTSWDTKSTRGREEVKKRLKNARLCGQPFNNKQIVNGRRENLPTLWVLSNCRTSIDYMKNWRLEEWSDRTKLETKEMKETPMQRYSHMNMVWECIMKEESFRPRREVMPQPRNTVSQYGRR